MKFRDYYRLLGLEPSATPDEIRRAYRTKARKLHPDVNKAVDAAQRFSEVNEANEVLGDPGRRAEYDQLRQQGWQDGQDMVPPPRAHGSAGRDAPGADSPSGDFGGASPEDFSTFFEALFGARQGRRREAHRERGEDMHHVIPVTLEEAYRGGERVLQLQTSAPGPDGSQARVRTITVKIPHGVTTGSHIRLRGQGQPGATAELNGDLYLEVRLEPHRLYRVDGRDVVLDLPVAPWEAVLGATMSTPTLGGPVTLSVPAGSRDGLKLRLKGRGLPGSPPGDQYVLVRIAVPTKVSDQTKAMWKDLGEASAFDPRVGLGGAA